MSGYRLDTNMNILVQLHADIDARVRAIRGDYPDWLCRMGCDSCCQRLAEIPRLTNEEWDWLREGLVALPTESLREIELEVAALVEQPLRPIICPLLNRSAGVCWVYAHRPVACRTYGFYIQRDQGLYCQDIQSRVADGDWAGVVWGHHDAIDRRLSNLGETRELTDKKMIKGG